MGLSSQDEFFGHMTASRRTGALRRRGRSDDEETISDDADGLVGDDSLG